MFGFIKAGWHGYQRVKQLEHKICSVILTQFASVKDTQINKAVIVCIKLEYKFGQYS